ncbi:MAG: DGQHR domain-containing protein [Gallionella sp.]|nr:DGQHR domain-containing protein [Gallionella sp.]
MNYNFVKVKQPIGEFYLTSIPANQVIRRVEVLSRTTNPDHRDRVQREYSGPRLDDIAQYVTDPDATFPTSIIISASSEVVKVVGNELVLPDEGIYGEVIDGQHRLKGLERVPERWADFDLPIVFMLDLDSEEKAYVFSIINSKQTPVAKSLIYDLFGLNQTRSPQRTAHEIARSMNADAEGPLFRSIKMLGKKKEDSEFITQGSFAKYLVALISRNPSKDLLDIKNNQPLQADPLRPFRPYWEANRDPIIQKILTNYFLAIKHHFKSEWEALPSEKRILRKTVGFSALMKALHLIWPKIMAAQRADKEFFDTIAEEFANNVAGQQLTTENFPSSEGVANKLARLLVPNPPEWKGHGNLSDEDLDAFERTAEL